MTARRTCRGRIRRLLAAATLLCCLAAFTLGAGGAGFDVEQAYASVFVVVSGTSLGSGFAIGENCVITNAHVIQNRNAVYIKTYAGTQYSAYVIQMDADLDIAVLGVSGVSFTPLPVADLDKVNAGDDVYAIGAPNALAYTLTKGIISSKARVIGGRTYLQTDAAINSGNSGGPLLDDAGAVVGVNSRKLSDAEGIGLAIPIDDVVAYMRTGELPLDEKGNVSGAILPETPGGQGAAETVRTVTEVRIPWPFAAVLALSLCLNGLLLILLLHKRRKSAAKAAADPSSRTDFEIEFFE